MAGIANTEQAEYWGAAQSWIDCRNMLDALLQPVLDRLLDGAALQPGQAVLDIGCGTGASSMAAARSVGADGQVTGADISALMLDLALQRAGCAGLENVTYLKSDVQTYPFEAAAFDHVISRFGVMFFDDPVAAFRNVRAAMRPGARLTFVAWAGQAVNPWFAIPRQAAVDVLGAPPSADPRAPGPMAFAERGYVRDILQAAGFAEVSTTEVAVQLTPPGTLDQVAALATHIGPAQRIIRDRGGSDADIARIGRDIARRLEGYTGPAGIRVPAALNLCEAECR